ncbi:MAG: hypothetical protein JNL34_05715 [Anaerolineae bacterium]|nr:hypothetical protein [Anaerolineae bacterium]
MLLKSHRSASPALAQREIAPLTAVSLNLTQPPHSRERANAVALSRVAGNRATRPLIQRCAFCGGKDGESVQRSFFVDLTKTASSAVGGVGSRGQGVVNGASGAVQNASEPFNNLF